MCGCNCIPVFDILNLQSMIDDHCVSEHSELKHQLRIATCRFNPKVSETVKKILESNFKWSGKWKRHITRAKSSDVKVVNIAPGRSVLLWIF